MQLPFRILSLLVLVGTLAGQADAAKPDDGPAELTVSLQSGRTFTAAVDVRTNAEQLWLRFEDGATTFWRPIRWERVVAADYEGRSIAGEELRAVAEQIESRGRMDAEALPPPAEAVAAPVAPVAEVVPSVLVPAPVALPPVRSLAIEARAANWDADVEIDGLLVTAYALDGAGCAVPVQGVLSVEAIGTQPSALRSEFVHSRGAPFPRLGQWTQQIETFTAPAGGACVRLPFRTLHPEFDLELGAYGLVHARLVVPGQGVFEASAGLVRVQPYSPIRDYREQLYGDRFFAGEWIGRWE